MQVIWLCAWRSHIPARHVHPAWPGQGPARMVTGTGYREESWVKSSGSDDVVQGSLGLSSSDIRVTAAAVLELHEVRRCYSSVNTQQSAGEPAPVYAPLRDLLVECCRRQGYRGQGAMSEQSALAPVANTVVEILSDTDPEDDALRIRVSGRLRAEVGFLCRACTRPVLIRGCPTCLTQQRRASGEFSGRSHGVSVPSTVSPPLRIRRVVPPRPSVHEVALDGSPPASQEDLVVLSSTVVPVQRPAFKRRREGSGWGPLKLPAVPRAKAAPPELQQAMLDPVQPGPKCGICMEPMGGSTGRSMASGPCG